MIQKLNFPLYKYPTHPIRPCHNARFDFLGPLNDDDVVCPIEFKSGKMLLLNLKLLKLVVSGICPWRELLSLFLKETLDTPTFLPIKSGKYPNSGKVKRFPRGSKFIK